MRLRRVVLVSTLRRWRLLLAVGLVSSLSACAWSPPSDEAVSRQLRENAQTFATLLKMLREDPRVGAIGADFTWETGQPYVGADVAQLGITKDRLAEYRRLFDLGGIRRFDRGDGETLQFMLWGRGFGGHTHHKGLTWSQRPLHTDRGRRYAPIADNWYLFED